MCSLPSFKHWQLTHIFKTVGQIKYIWGPNPVHRQPAFYHCGACWTGRLAGFGVWLLDRTSWIVHFGFPSAGRGHEPPTPGRFPRHVAPWAQLLRALLFWKDDETPSPEPHWRICCVLFSFVPLSPHIVSHFRSRASIDSFRRWDR